MKAWGDTRQKKQQVHHLWNENNFGKYHVQKEGMCFEHGDWRREWNKMNKKADKFPQGFWTRVRNLGFVLRVTGSHCNIWKEWISWCIVQQGYPGSPCRARGWGKGEGRKIRRLVGWSGLEKMVVWTPIVKAQMERGGVLGISFGGRVVWI